MRRALLAILLLVISASGSAADVGARSDPSMPSLHFRRLLVNVGGERTEACLRFDQPLNADAAQTYAEHLAIAPKLRPALRIEGPDLCIGNLEFGARYDVTALSGLAASSGARLESDIKLRVGLGDRPASVAIAGDGFILPRATAHGLAIQTVNVDRVRVHVFRLSVPGAIERTGAAAVYPEVDLTAQNLRGYEFIALLRSSLTEIWHGDMDVGSIPNRTVETSFPLVGIIDAEKPGLYLVIAENGAKATREAVFARAMAGSDAGDNRGWPDSGFTAHWVNVTNTALTTYSGQDGLHVFARALDTARPVRGLHVRLLSRGQDMLAEAVTDADGAVAFAPGVTRGIGAEAPVAVSADGDGGRDFTIQRLDRPAFDFSDRGASGAEPPGPAQAFMATDRGIYRPGETVHSTMLLRDRQGRAIDDQRVTLVLRRPDGVEMRRQTLPAAPGGGIVQVFHLTDTAAFGTWRIDALTDQTAPPVGSVAFSVQDFVPQLLAVTLRPAAATLAMNQASAAVVQGRFLYGAPAAGLHGKAELRIERDPAPVAGADGYRFGLADEPVAITPAMIDIPAADAAGRATIAFTPAIPAGLTAPLRAVLRAGLFEPGGRIVEDESTLPIRANRILIGVKASGNAAGDDGMQAAPVDIATFDAAGKPVAAKDLHWAVIRENRIYDWFETGGTWSFHYHVIDEPIASGTVATFASGRGRVTPGLDWGNYRVVVSDAASGATSSTHFDIGWTNAASGPDSPDKIQVSIRNSTLRPGAATVLHIAAAFAGRAQVTIAGSRIFETHMLTVPKGGADLPITARAEWGAGAYALVTLYRPMNVAARPHDPVRAVGLAWIGLDQGPRTLTVSLQSPAQILPRRRLLVPVRVEGGVPGQVVRLSLAAVDEGILQLTRYRTPNPVAALFGKRRLGLDMRDDYGRLLDGSADAGVIHEGGDQGSGATGGGPGLPVVSSRIVSLFSGPVTLDANASGTVALDVPDFEGKLRLMAIAWSADAVGAGEAGVTVRDPVFADIALPRFLAAGDDATIAVSIANTDGPAGSYHLVLAASGAVRIAGAHAFDATLKPGARIQLAADLRATEDGIGAVSATLTRKGDRAPPALIRQWQIAVRPGHFPVTLSESAEQKPGEVFKVEPTLLAGYIPGSASVTVGYAGFAGIDTVGLLQSLGDVEWDCSEQLASSAWPLLYFNDPGLLGRLPPPGAIRARVQHAVDAILDREDAAGRFGLWRVNDGAASPWLDVYLLDFLLHAKQSGFDVAQPALDRALDWLEEEQVRGSGDFERYQGTAPETRAYALFVLARAGRASPDAIRRMRDDASAQAYDDKVRLVFWGDTASEASFAGPLALGHLAAALTLTGDAELSHGTFAMAVMNLGDLRFGRADWFNFIYWSYVRDLAGLVSLAADSGRDQLAQSLVGRFGRLGLTPPRLSTQEKAALLGAAHALDRDEPGRRLAVNGAATAGMLHLPAAFSPDQRQLARGYRLANVGKVPLWRTLTVTGSPSAASPPSAHGYTLDRTFLTIDGQRLDPSQVRQNDRFLVVLHGRADDDDDHRSVIVDMLPAGWEIEGPVLAPDRYPFVGALTRPRSIEARDDRLVAAFDLGSDLDPPRFIDVDDDHDAAKPAPLDAPEFRVAYLVRAVTVGQFTRPEAVVQDMYRPALTARTGSGTTKITPPP